MSSRLAVLAHWGNRGAAGLARWVALLALASGIGLWGALLLAPLPVEAPPMLEAGPAQTQTAEPLVQWFGGGSARLRLKIIGVIASGKGGAALLSINGGPAQAFRVGQELVPGITLSAVEPETIAIDQDGLVEEVAIPERAPLPKGFLTVPL